MPLHDIIVIAADPWKHYTWRRRHHIAWNLAKDNRVLFIEPPITLLQPFTDIDLSWRHLFNIGRIEHHGRNLYSYSPFRKYPLSLPFSRIVDYNRMNREDVLQDVKRVAAKLRFRNPILWVYYHPYHYDYYGLFNEKLVITDWYDKHTAPVDPKTPQTVIDKIRVIEDRILEKADLVFVASNELAKDLGGRNKNLYVVPHGIDIDTFHNAHHHRDTVVKQIKQISRPLLVFLGLLHNKIDFNLLTYVADKRTEWSILLIGKQWLWGENDLKSYKRLKERKNVHYIGEVKKELVPAYLERADVCLIPMKKIEVNRVTTGPLKLWDYLAAGKPVVAVDQGVEFDCSEFIKTAKNADEFVCRIEECLMEGRDTVLEAKRKQVALENSWETRVKYMLKIIDAYR